MATPYDYNTNWYIGRDADLHALDLELTKKFEAGGLRFRNGAVACSVCVGKGRDCRRCRGKGYLKQDEFLAGHIENEEFEVEVKSIVTPAVSYPFPRPPPTPTPSEGQRYERPRSRRAENLDVPKPNVTLRRQSGIPAWGEPMEGRPQPRATYLRRLRNLIWQG